MPDEPVNIYKVPLVFWKSSVFSYFRLFFWRWKKLGSQNVRSWSLITFPSYIQKQHFRKPSRLQVIGAKLRKQNGRLTEMRVSDLVIFLPKLRQNNSESLFSEDGRKSNWFPFGFLRCTRTLSYGCDGNRQTTICPKKFRHFQFVLTNNFTAKIFRTSKFLDNVNDHRFLGLRRKLASSDKYFKKYNAEGYHKFWLEAFKT